MDSIMLDLEESADEKLPSRSGWKRFFKFLAIGLLLMAAGALLARWQVGRVGQHQLEQEAAHLDSTEPGWRLDAILRARLLAAPSEAHNPANVVLGLHAQIPLEWTKFRARRQWEWDTVSKEQPSFEEFFWLLRGRDLSRGIRDALLRGLLAPEILKSQAGYYQIAPKENPYQTLLPHLQNARIVLDLLEYDARLSLLEGNADRAIGDARAALVIARSIGDEPYLISQLTRLACARMAVGITQQALAWRVPVVGLKELQDEFLAEARTPWLEYGLRGERATINKFFDGLNDGAINFEEVGLLGEQGKGSLRSIGFKAYRALLPGDQAKALEILSQYVVAAQRPSHEWTSAIAQIKLPPRPPEDFRYICTSLLAPNCSKVTAHCLLTKADLLTGAAAIACERFRQKKGHWPNNLGELVPTFLPAIPLDPHNAREIQFCNDGNRVEIWCVGDSDRPRMNGFQPMNPEAIDPATGLRYGYRGWRLWDRELRYSPRPPTPVGTTHSEILGKKS